jgi:hypothetical protein
VTPGNALQLGELTDHVGLQVILGQLRGTLRLGGIDTTCGAITAASAATRATLSATVPSLAW